MQTKVPYEIVKKQELQRLQDGFCRVTGVCAYCIDADGKKLSEISGREDQIEMLSAYQKDGTVAFVLDRVREGSLEDQAIETVGENGENIAAIAMRIDGVTLIYWIVLQSDVDEERDSLHFFYTLDLLRDASHTLLYDKVCYYSAEAEAHKSRYAELEMSENLRNTEATTSIVQLLDHNGRIDQIMDKWLQIMAEHMKVDTAQIFRISPDNTKMDVICQWCAPGKVSYFEKTRNQEILDMLRTDKALVISTETVEGRGQDVKLPEGVEAVIVMPIMRRDTEQRLILSVNHRSRHTWAMEEVKFAADAVKVLQSILTKRFQAESLASSHEAMEAILDNVGCAIYVTDKKTGDVLFANRRLKSTFGKELQDGTFMELLQEGLEAERTTGYAEVFHTAREKWYDVVCKEISWVDGKAADLYSLFNITDKKQYQRRIEQQAYTDFLTGLYNRMCCERDLARQIDVAQKTNTIGALLYLDLDDFKHINDGLGHQYGDVLLKSISNSLQMIQGIEQTCYRMGGDEFVIVVPTNQYIHVDRIVEDIKQVFIKPWFLNGADYYCTMSMGIVTYPDKGNTVADLIRKADIAMYEAKKSGKNRVSSYHEGTDTTSGRRLDMEKNMRDATADGYQEFQVYFQPIMDIQGEKDVCAGAEALIRWNSTKFGFIPPDEFIPLAEYLGLINPIGNYVLKEACQKCHHWNEHGYPHYKVNVNLSVVQLLQTDVAELVEQTIKETGINPRNLTLEVTESLAINDMGRMKGILNRIKELGVQIALDDFGTGYSSLNHIREIPLDVIKVDQSFVKELAMDAYSQSFVKMISELAKTLGASICVEGIETETQCNVVRGLNVKYIQGYYFGRPMNCSEFEEKFAPLARSAQR